ncbi:YceI family protein [Arachidicoccus terrestris]|uniref:YceI family protein n=1 Tax=Arachidicoccus terrestris TaxID=2875539 RepID=UPI001CC6F4D1|nr:YceI family protein [Arachidicoccus terrestris]UAY56589.1 YceI family protein [Arachidicoccus terrestris]
MKRLFFLIMVLALISVKSEAQSYFTRGGQISFFSKSPVEDIKAENHQVLAIIDPVRHKLAFNLLIKGFLFEKQLMQDHFNEDVMESDRFPKATFTGSMKEGVKEGLNHVHLTGQLTIRGITKPLNTMADLELKNQVLHGNCQFKISLADYKIKIPAVLKNNIAPDILVTVNVDCKLMQKK